MTREQHATASRALIEIIRRNCAGTAQKPDTASADNELFGMLALHHAKRGSLYARCDDCYIGFSLPDPDNEPECPSCHGCYWTITRA